MRRLADRYRRRFHGGDQIVVEVKAVHAIHPIFEVQLLTYLRLSGRTLGLLLNFNVEALKDGIRRVIDDRPRA